MDPVYFNPQQTPFENKLFVRTRIEHIGIGEESEETDYFSACEIVVKFVGYPETVNVSRLNHKQLSWLMKIANQAKDVHLVRSVEFQVFEIKTPDDYVSQPGVVFDDEAALIGALSGILANPVYFNHTPERIAQDAIRAVNALSNAIMNGGQS